MINRIITHNDFDGIASAAICISVFDTELVYFTGPSQITENRIPVSETDVVCDLPYPLECGMWFDHHAGNLKDVLLRDLDPDQIPGVFAPEKSCARVVYNYFLKEYKLPEDFAELVREADRIDSFSYKTIEEWREVTPAHIINEAIKNRWNNFRKKNQFLNDRVIELCDTSLEEVSQLDDIQKSYESFCEEETKMLEIIKKRNYFHELDPANEIIIVDLTDLKWQPFVIKNLAYLLYPEALAVLQLQNLYRNQVKTNSINFSIALSIKLNNQEHKKDVGEIMRSLNIGDGHCGAASGLVQSASKSEQEKNKRNILEKILTIWKNQK